MLTFKQFVEECWDGYERVPGTKEFAKGSCRKKKVQEAVSKPMRSNRPGKTSMVKVKNAKTGRVKTVHYGDSKLGAHPNDPKRKKSYCARSAGQMKMFPKAAKDPNSPLRLSRKKWKC